MSRLPAIDQSTHVCDSPHIVILGAGASRAACPDGDAMGRPLPIMNDIVDLLDLRKILPPTLLDGASDFEALYDHLADTAGNEDPVKNIN